VDFLIVGIIFKHSLSQKVKISSFLGGREMPVIRS